MKFSNKSLIVSASIIISLYLFILGIPILNPIFISFVVSIIYYFALYWLLDFDIELLGFVNILLLASIYIQSIALFILTIIKLTNNGIFEYFLIAIFLIFTQIINRVFNITNVSSIKKIPLFQVSQSFNYILSVLAILLASLSVQILNISAPYYLLYLLFIIVIIFFSNISLADSENEKADYIFCVLASLLNFAFAAIVIFISTNIVLRSIIISSITFILIGVFYSFSNKEKVTLYSKLQIIVISILIILSLIIWS